MVGIIIYHVTLDWHKQGIYVRSLLNVPLEKVGINVHKAYRRTIVNTQRFDTIKLF